MAGQVEDVEDPRVRAAGAALRHRMVRRIVAGGGLADPAWRSAFEEVPRHLFVPEYRRGACGEGRYRADDPDLRRRLAWVAGVYADEPIATHLAGGEPVSAGSQPSLMALMCEALDIRPGHRVLEIGTGTGYNAALIAHRLAGSGAVTTVDLDAAITGPARAHLAAYGTPEALAVEVVTGDGAFGHPPGAPYDRVMATCELPAVPPAWLEQCGAGALILAPLASGLVLLTVLGPRRAEGRFLATPAYFVPLRGAGAGTAPPELGAEPSPAGRPARTRYGLSVDGDRQWIWLDTPGGPVTRPLPPART
ncbi:methyltransferase domain-containing protein [Actinacidiphila epipremni]|uniref:Protein-L-isoaspartate O-methyltransferase n=1 Tax=Actinacidiphila epipremni TaxID=2053013 RepID=A0ABX0ZK31_9ACTN|nr:methyltransferase domain-containing protein [Actinacidiphila epipremni]NJP42013.1 methyltransferase domain-containing protein [Actinacidiphila epipremni]